MPYFVSEIYLEWVTPMFTDMRRHVGAIFRDVGTHSSANRRLFIHESAGASNEWPNPGCYEAFHSEARETIGYETRNKAAAERTTNEFANELAGRAFRRFKWEARRTVSISEE